MLMGTTVVNLKAEPYDVYIGRAGRGEDGYFGNPIRIGGVCPRCGDAHPDAGSTLPCYTAYFNERMIADSVFYRRVCELKGKRLGCFCKPGPCHGDVIVEWLESW